MPKLDVERALNQIRPASLIQETIRATLSDRIRALSTEYQLPDPLYAYCTISFCVCKVLIINEIVVEATGVELFRVLITRNLLILGTATTAKKAPLPDPLYVYCTKMLFALESNRHHMAATVSHRFSGMDRKST